MTTFAFANVEYSSYGAASFQHGEQTIYTVPSGKLAKIKFDSYHFSLDGTDKRFADVLWALYSQNSSSTAVRKHMVGHADFGGGTTALAAFYNPSNFNGLDAETGQQTAVYTNRLHSAQPETFVYNNQVQDFGNQTYFGNWTSQNQGATVYGPETFFMAAGEVLKLRTLSVCSSSAASAACTRYTNMRCAVWLEDV